MKYTGKMQEVHVFKSWKEAHLYKLLLDNNSEWNASTMTPVDPTSWRSSDSIDVVDKGKDNYELQNATNHQKIPSAFIGFADPNDTGIS